MEEGKEVEEDEPGRVDGENLDDGTDTVNTNSEEETEDMSNEENLPQAQKLPQLDGHIEHEQDNSDSERPPTMLKYREMTKEEERLFEETSDEDIYEGEVPGKGDCEVCGKVGRRCKGCFRAHYCGPVCQKKIWKEHKVACVAQQNHIKLWGRH